MDTPRYGRGQVIEIINSVIDKVDASGANRDVFVHMAELAEIIDALRKDISSYQPQHVKNSHIPDATDELDAVVNATAEATDRIMTACEEIGDITAALDEQTREAIMSKTTEIYEACSFQDITGQRIKNVVTTLRLIEDKIDLIMGTLGEKVGLKVSDAKLEKAKTGADDQSLMNGPQLPGNAISQADIDRLLAEFDNA